MSDILPNNNNFILYSDPSGNVKIEAYMQDETIWLKQQRMADVFGFGKSTISEHLATIYGSGELEKVATVRNFRTVQIEGECRVARNLEYYNLDTIISAGYSLNSTKATQFRIRSTNLLKEFILKVMFLVR